MIGHFSPTIQTWNEGILCTWIWAAGRGISSSLLVDEEFLHRFSCAKHFTCMKKDIFFTFQGSFWISQLVFFQLSASTATEVRRQLTVVCHQDIGGFSASDSLAKDRVDFWRSFKQWSHPLEILLEKSTRKFMSSLSPSHGTTTRTHLTRSHVRPVQLDVHSTGLRVVYNTPSKWIRII